MQVFRKLSDFSLDENDPVPKYEQLKRILLAYIAGLPPDREYLPYEEEICRQFGISRRTVRRALEELRRNGVIETTKKRGSRVVKRNFSPDGSDEDLSSLINGSAVGLVTVSDREDTIRSDSFRGQMVVELERLLIPQECSLVVYNMRQNHWQDWQDYDALVDSMKDKGIKWALVYVHGESVKVELLHKLLRAGIKPVAVIQAFSSMGELAPHWLPGIDYVAINHTGSIVQALHEHFPTADLVAYVSNESDSFWSRTRADACREFAVSRGIPFECLVSPSLGEIRGEIDAATVQELLQLCSGREYPVCFAANDMTAESIMENMHTLKPDARLDNLQLVGYDNSIEQRSLNISTFDFDASTVSRAVLDLYRDFLRAPEHSLRVSRGIMVYSKFIDRTSL